MVGRLSLKSSQAWIEEAEELNHAIALLLESLNALHSMLMPKEHRGSSTDMMSDLVIERCV